MPNHEHIYAYEAKQYDRLIEREDLQQNVLRTLARLLPEMEGKDALDLGAGTGKLACLLAPQVRSLQLTDASEAMLEVAARKLKSMGTGHWKACAADHRTLPFADGAFDLITAGWTICYATHVNAPDWRVNLERIMKELLRVLRPGGTIVIFETMGTGNEQPEPPPILQPYYEALETDFGFAHDWMRTDFAFESAEEAEQLTRFFFGDELADRVRKHGQTLVPGCTGVWWKTIL